MNLNFFVLFCQYGSSRQIPSHSKTKYPEVQIPGTNVIVKLVKGDITIHRADAIVNASNQELELRSAGVSGSIMAKGISNKEIIFFDFDF